MNQSTVAKEIVTVAEMARFVGLSRARFYSLMRQGVFPAPSRDPATKRPFYDRKNQKRCIEVRRTNCGANGRPVLFYAKRLDHQTGATTRRPRIGTAKKKALFERADIIGELRHGLSQLGLVDVSTDRIRLALAECCPDGHDGNGAGALLQLVFHRIGRQNSQDKQC